MSAAFCSPDSSDVHGVIRKCNGGLKSIEGVNEASGGEDMKGLMKKNP